MNGVLSILIFAPFVLGLGLFLIPQSHAKKIPWVSFGISLGLFLWSLLLLWQWNLASMGFQYVERVSWIPTFGIDYHIGIDGISLWLVLLTTALTPLVILSSVKYIQKSHHLYYFLFLALETTMLGTFLSLDLFLFYLFWELMLFPMLLIIGIWGGKRRIYAALKFFLYTMVGSLFMLVGIFVIITMYKEQFGYYSTSIIDLYQLYIPGGYSFFDLQSLLFIAFMFAFAIKVPVFPLHTWLPDAHVEAPTGGSVILAGVLLKMGTYAMLRFALPLFPLSTYLFSPYLIGLGIIGIIYGACVAMVQPDLKKLVAYSSVSHLGYCMVGIFALNIMGLSGSLYVMLAHGISTGALFTIVGFLYERTHTREIAHYGGIAKSAPFLVMTFFIITLSSIGLPTTNGFIGEFLVLFGAYEVSWHYAFLAGLGVILGAIYMLWMFRRVCFGPLKDKAADVFDLSKREWGIMVPYILMVFVLGMASPFFMKYMEPALQGLLSLMHSKVAGI
jgi:NADH-quinone oxidoreductase subunit M